MREVDDGLLVYDLETDACISLEGAAAVIWRACDGTRDARALAALASPGTDESVVAVVLEQLRAQGLLDEATLEDPAGLRGLSRREMLVRLGVASAAVPLVSNLVVPVAAAAQSAVSPTSLRQDGSTTTTPGGGSSTTTTLADGSTTTTSTSTTTTSTTSSTTTTSTTTPCTPDGGACDFNDPGACCSLTCIATPGGPVCGPGCVPSGSPCDLNNPGACCSQTCVNGSPTPTCL